VSLKSKLIVRSAVTFLIASGLLFIPATTFDYWQAWVYLAIVFVPMVVFSVYYYAHDRALVERRMETQEKEKEQVWIMRAAMTICIVGFLIPGLDHRLGWTRRLTGPVPLWLELVSLLLVLAGYLGTMWVTDVNRYAARTIRVEQHQPVISTGPYRYVRHPLYAGGLLMWLATAPALGSFVALPVCFLLVPVFVLRLVNEENLLRRDLPGYQEYCEHTRYRLVPYIW